MTGTNVALLFGAELDAQLESGRQLQAGIAAEQELQLPPKDTRVVQKNEAAEEMDVKRGRWFVVPEAVATNASSARRLRRAHSGYRHDAYARET
jgi:hypothetical protein